MCRHKGSLNKNEYSTLACGELRDVIHCPHMKQFLAPLLLALMSFYIGFAPASAQQQTIQENLIKGSGEAVYWYGRDGQRHVFPNLQTFSTWFPYSQFQRVQQLSDRDLAAIPLGQNVFYRPGSRLIKITTDPKVYAVGYGGVLIWLETEQVARDLYGPNWRIFVDDMPDAFFGNYTIWPQSISDARNYNPTIPYTPDNQSARPSF